MIVKTRNSFYRVTANGDRFHIWKVSLDNIEAVLMPFGGFLSSNYLTLHIGEPMLCAGLITSPVESVTEE